MGYYVLTEDAAVKLRKLLGDSALVEVRADATRAAPRQPVADPVQFVRVTDDEPDDGTYTGYWQKYLAGDDTWEDGSECRVREVAGGTLAAGKYLARRYGVEGDGYPVFVVPGSSGGAPVAAGANDLDQDTITTGDDITASGGIVTWGTVHNYGGTDFWDGVTAPTSGGSTTDRQVITFPSAGRYLVECGITWEANSSGDRHLVLQWGTSLSALVRKAVSQRACASGVTRQGIVATGEVDADETMAVRVMQSSGGDLDLASGILQVTFWPA